jgi:hypothetical protein
VLELISVKTGGQDLQLARGEVRTLERLDRRAERLRIAQQMARSMERPVVTAPRELAQPRPVRFKEPDREMD